jgi:hypothetical protein
MSRESRRWAGILLIIRKPQVPEYIVSQSFYFRIDVDGQIIAYDRETGAR